jgi:hypothetical protein
MANALSNKERASVNASVSKSVRLTPPQEREPTIARYPSALLWGGNHVDRARMKLPRSSVERFKSLARSLYGLRRALRVGDINSVLKALEWMPV